MKTKTLILTICLVIFTLVSCRHNQRESGYELIFLHHSTGDVLWNGDITSSGKKVNLPLLFRKYNRKNNKDYIIHETEFPKSEPYGWNNYPFDYYNIWVKNQGETAYLEEPTLELLTKEYNLVIFKHCFPVSNIQPDQFHPDINSDIKTISNYKLQYLAIRDKLHEFPATKFILFTGAAQLKNNITKDEAERARIFFDWVVNEWDVPEDNIFIWDFYQLQTEGELFFKDEYAVSQYDSHPNKEFAGRVVTLLFNRIIDVIENNGNKTQLTGKEK